VNVGKHIAEIAKLAISLSSMLVNFLFHREKHVGNLEKCGKIFEKLPAYPGINNPE
jgi:hypothetical protein